MIVEAALGDAGPFGNALDGNLLHGLLDKQGTPGLQELPARFKTPALVAVYRGRDIVL